MPFAPFVCFGRIDVDVGHFFWSQLRELETANKATWRDQRVTWVYPVPQKKHLGLGPPSLRNGAMQASCRWRRQPVLFRVLEMVASNMAMKILCRHMWLRLGSSIHLLGFQLQRGGFKGQCR